MSTFKGTEYRFVCFSDGTEYVEHFKDEFLTGLPTPPFSPGGPGSPIAP